MPKNVIPETCGLDGNCDNYTFYYIVAIVAAIIIGGLIYINMKKSSNNDTTVTTNNISNEDSHVHGCDGDKCY